MTNRVVFSDHDEGISVSGGSPGATYDPLMNGFVPPFLSSIWSDLDDPKSEPPRRASLGSNSSGSELFSSGKFASARYLASKFITNLDLTHTLLATSRRLYVAPAS